jgi:hypothetical protein
MVMHSIPHANQLKIYTGFTDLWSSSPWKGKQQLLKVYAWTWRMRWKPLVENKSDGKLESRHFEKFHNNPTPIPDRP